jgi:hypothetical protein
MDSLETGQWAPDGLALVSEKFPQVFESLIERYINLTNSQDIL